MVFKLVKNAVELLIWQMSNHFLDSSVIASVCFKINSEQYVKGPVDEHVMQLFLAPVDEPRSPGATSRHKHYRCCTDTPQTCDSNVFVRCLLCDEVKVKCRLIFHIQKEHFKMQTPCPTCPALLAANTHTASWSCVVCKP